VIVEPQPIDQRFGALETKHPRLRIAGLRPRCDGSRFQETEAERREAAQMLGILVETRSHTDAIGKFDAHRASRFGCKTWRRKLRDAERRCAVQRSKGNL